MSTDLHHDLGKAEIDTPRIGVNTSSRSGPVLKAEAG